MSHSVDQSGTVESFLVQNITQILTDFIFIIPVADVLFQIVKHTLYLDIGAAMLWSLQRAEGSGDRRIGICSGRGNNVCCKCGVVTTAMLSMEYER